MGVVYKARHLALKAARRTENDRRGSRSGGSCQRLKTEAETVARLQHPNIVQIYEVGDTPAPVPSRSS